MKRGGKRWATEQGSKLKLSTGGRQQVVAANDQIDLVSKIVHNNCELVGPLSVPIAHQQITTLLLRTL